MSTASEEQPSKRASSRFHLPALRLPTPRGADVTASLTGAVAGVPDALAAGVIVGVSPINGLYAAIVAPIVGGLTARTKLLVISTTSASALAAAEAVRQYEGDDRVAALLLLTFLAGVIQVVVSLLRPVKITSFVSHSVMTGFLIGIGTLVVLGQLGTFFGYSPSGPNSVAKTADLAVNFGSFDLASIAIGMTTLVLILVAPKLHLGSVGALVALAAASVAVAGLDMSSVETVSDVADIPSGFPLPALPGLEFFSVSFLLSAFALGAVVFVQTVGVSQGLPHDDSRETQAHDIRASGLANIGASLFQGQPVGGSMGQSALNVSSGAQTRAASVMVGLWTLLVVLLLAPVVQVVPMPSLAALLIVAGATSINAAEAMEIWHTGWASRLTITVTFLLTLLLPIQYAVLLGIALSVVLYLVSASEDVHVTELDVLPGGQLRERDAPVQLESGQALVLDVYGSLFYAGARTLARRLPEIGNAHDAVVIVRLRGRCSVGATAIDVLTRYATGLRAAGGRLYLAGLNPELQEQLRRSGKLTLQGVRFYPAFHFIGKSVSMSYKDATAWLAENQAQEVA